MIYYVAAAFAVVTVIVILWLVQPYKNWKKNFDARQYQPISITDSKGTTLSLTDYQSKVESEPKPELSLVVPAYNEEERISSMLADVAAFVKSKKITHEISIANDGSRDNTTKVAL